MDEWLANFDSAMESEEAAMNRMLDALDDASDECVKVPRYSEIISRTPYKEKQYPPLEVSMITADSRIKADGLNDLIKGNDTREDYVNNTRVMLTFLGKLDITDLQFWVAMISKKMSLDIKEVSFSGNENKTYVLIIWGKAFRTKNRRAFDYKDQLPVLIAMKYPKDLRRVRAFMKEENTLEY